MPAAPAPTMTTFFLPFFKEFFEDIIDSRAPQIA